MLGSIYMDHRVLPDDITPEDLLDQAGLRKTPVRIAILHVLRRAKEPINASDILERAEGFAMNRVTVYRTLESLAESGVVTSLDLGRGHALYELSAGRHHHHFSCQRCQKITAIDVHDEDNLLKAMSKKYGVKILQHAIELSGVCRQCR